MTANRTVTRSPHQCTVIDTTLPQPATSKQVWYRKQQGDWREGLSRREASTLIGRQESTERVA